MSRKILLVSTFLVLSQTLFTQMPASASKETEQKKAPPKKYNTIRAVAISPDGRKVATVCGRVSIEIWDFFRVQGLKAWPEPLRSFPDLLSGSDDVVLFSADGSKLYLRLDGQLTQLDIASGEIQRKSGAIPSVLEMKLLPDGKRIVTLHSSTIRLWDIAKGELVHDIFGEEVKGSVGFRRLALSADGKRVLTGNDRGAVVEWDLEKREELRALRTTAEDNGVNGLAYVDNDKKAVVAHARGGLRVWNLQDGSVEHTIGDGKNAPFRIAVSPNGKLVAGGSRIISLWDLKTGKELATSPDYDLKSTHIAFSPDSRFLILAGGRETRADISRPRRDRIDEDRALLVWDLRTYQIAGILAYPDLIRGK